MNIDHHCMIGIFDAYIRFQTLSYKISNPKKCSECIAFVELVPQMSKNGKHAFPASVNVKMKAR